jgi:hypothetical protein
MRSVTTYDIDYRRVVERRMEWRAVIAFLLSVLSGPATMLIVIGGLSFQNSNPHPDVLWIILLFAFALVPELVAGWIAIRAVRRIAQSEGKLKGSGLAMAAVVISIFAGPLGIFGALLLIACVMASISL